MIRFGTLFTLSVAVAAGIGLFHAKYRVQALEAELSSLQRQVQQDRETIHVLSAEWSYLNDPARLAELARRHLEMAPIAGSQLATIEDVPEKLPLPAPTPPLADDDDAPANDAPPAPPLVAVAPAPAPAPVAAAKPAPPPFAELPADVQAVLASMRSAQ